MKVLQINATYGYSSTGLIVKDIGDAIEKSGNEALFAYQKGNVPDGKGYVVGNNLDWKFHALLCRLLGKQGYYSSGATKKFLRYLDKEKPDVVHLHNLHSNFINLNMLLEYLAKKDIPTVITMHDCWYFTGKCFHYVDVGCQGFMTDCKNCPKKSAPPKSMIFDCAHEVLKDRYKYLSKIPRLRFVGCSDWVCGEARKGILKDFDFSRVYNGVDTGIFRPRDTEKIIEQYDLKDKRVILGMANKWLLESNKDVFNKIRESIDENSVLMLIGCTDEQKNFLKKFNNVLGVGFIKNRDELAEHYSLADVFVNVTHADTLPTVNMESICCGTPVITYDSCGSPELVIDGCGEIVRENDIQGILSALKKTGKEKNKHCSQMGREIYDKSKCYSKYIDIYEEIIRLER